MRLARTITAANRAEILRAVELAPLGSLIDLTTDLRTLAQNRMMWMNLSQLGEQLEHGGEHYDAEAWKCAFLKAMGQKLEFMPALDGEGVVAIGYRSSKLSKEKFSELIERIYEYGARHGVEFHGPKGSRAA
jgi:NinB protein